MKKNLKYILAFFGIVLFGGLAYLFIGKKTATTTSPTLGNSALPTTSNSAEIEDIKKRLVKLEDNFE